MQVTYVGPVGPVEVSDGPAVHLAHFGDSITVSAAVGASLLEQTDAWKAKPTKAAAAKALAAVDPSDPVTTGDTAATAPEATPQ